jgi:hypothetical protein
MSGYEALFDDVKARLKAGGIEVDVEKNDPASLRETELFQSETGLVLPDSFVGFYRDFADGLIFKWEIDDDIRGYFAMPTLADLTTETKQWMKMVDGFVGDPGSMDMCIEEEYRSEAFSIWNRMKSWIPFWNDPNGDHFCVDVSNGKIVFDQHDWYDGFGRIETTNGIEAGTSLHHFIESWSRFCFRLPEGCMWSLIGRSGHIHWDASNFDMDFLGAGAEAGAGED